MLCVCVREGGGSLWRKWDCRVYVDRMPRGVTFEGARLNGGCGDHVSMAAGADAASSSDALTRRFGWSDAPAAEVHAVSPSC